MYFGVYVRIRYCEVVREDKFSHILIQSANRSGNTVISVNTDGMTPFK